MSMLLKLIIVCFMASAGTKASLCQELHTHLRVATGPVLYWTILFLNPLSCPFLNEERTAKGPVF